MKKILVLTLFMCLLHENSFVSVKGIVDTIVPGPVQRLFYKKSETEKNSHEHNASTVTKKEEEKDSIKEHGSLDFFGRDFIKNVSRKFDNVKEGIENTFSKISDGLDCNKTFFNGMLDSFKNRVRAIYPGTKWCGDGAISQSYDDLGRFAQTDSCCREHDNCPNNIGADKTKYGLQNTGLFTRSHCDCDEQFYNCLKSANSVISKSIGVTYFTVLGPQCFREDYPVIGCKKKEMGKCIDYEFNKEMSQRIYQWFDSPTF